MQKQSRTIYSMKNIFSGFVGQLVTTIATFVCRMVFVRFLSAEYLGVNGLFMNILSVLSLAEMGIGTAIVYELYRAVAYNDEDKIAALMRFYAKAYRSIGVVVSVIGICIIPFLNFFVKKSVDITENMYIIYCFYLFNTSISYFYSYKQSILIANQKSYLISYIQTACKVSQEILQIIALALTHNFYVYLSCQIIMTLVFNIVISKTADKLYPVINRKDLKAKVSPEMKSGLIKNIRALIIRKLSAVLVNSTDHIIISAVVGLTASGVTSNYVMLTNTLNTILLQVFNGLTASIGNINAIESKEKKMKTFYIVNFLNFWLFGWCSIAFLILGSDLVKLCFGDKYVMSFAIVAIMAVNFYTTGMQNAIWTYRSTLGVFDKGKYIALFTGSLNILFSIIFGKLWGVFGILIATLAARILTNIWYDPYSIYRYGFEEKSIGYFARYIEYLVIMVLTYCITYVITIPCDKIPSFMLSVLVKLIICMLVPNLVFMCVYRKKEEFKFLQSKITGIVKSVIK